MTAGDLTSCCIAGGHGPPLQCIRRFESVVQQPARRAEYKIMVKRSILSLILVLSSYARAQGAQNNQDPGFPYTPSLDLTAMDKSVDACVDFYPLKTDLNAISRVRSERQLAQIVGRLQPTYGSAILF